MHSTVGLLSFHTALRIATVPRWACEHRSWLLLPLRTGDIFASADKDGSQEEFAKERSPRPFGARWRSQVRGAGTRKSLPLRRAQAHRTSATRRPSAAAPAGLGCCSSPWVAALWPLLDSCLVPQCLRKPVRRARPVASLVVWRGWATGLHRRGTEAAPGGRETSLTLALWSSSETLWTAQ